MLGLAAKPLVMLNYTKLVVQYRQSGGDKILEGVNWVKVVREDVGVLGDALFKQAETCGGEEGREVDNERKYDR